MLRRGVFWAMLVVLLAACYSTPPAKPKPTPALTLKQAQINAIVQNYWDVTEQAITHNDPSLFGTVSAGPALDQAKANLYLANHDPFNAPRIWPRPFVVATAFNLVQPPEANWFAVTITYDAVDQDGVVGDQVTEGAWIFVWVPGVSVAPSTSPPASPAQATPSPSHPSSSPAHVSPSPSGATPASPSPSGTARPSPTPAPLVGPTPEGSWMAYLRYDTTFVNLGISLDQANTSLKRPKEADYLYAATGLANSYAQYLSQISNGQQPVAPYQTGLVSFSGQVTAEPPGTTISNLSFSAYPDQPLMIYIDDNHNEVVLFALKRTATYSPQAPESCLVGNLSALLPIAGYTSMTLGKEIVVIATIVPKSTPSQGGRLLIHLDGASSDISASATGSC